MACHMHLTLTRALSVRHTQTHAHKDSPKRVTRKHTQTHRPRRPESVTFCLSGSLIPRSWRVCPITRLLCTVDVIAAAGVSHASPVNFNVDEC